MIHKIFLLEIRQKTNILNKNLLQKLLAKYVKCRPSGLWCKM